MVEKEGFEIDESGEVGEWSDQGVVLQTEDSQLMETS